MQTLLSLARGSLLTLLAVAVLSASGHAQISTDAVSLAVQRYICFNAYWEGRQYPLGKTVTMSLRKAGDWAYAKIERAVTLGPHQYDGFYAVYNLNGEALVAHSSGINAREYRDPTELVSLPLPADCTPKAGPKRPLEQEMMKVVESTIRHKLRDFNEHAGTDYRNPVRVIIADFEWDYPRTFVFVPQKNEILSVTLHDATAPGDDRFLRQGEYPMGFRQPLKSVTARIRQHGITRDIRLYD